MRSACTVRPAGQWDNAAAVDLVMLDSSERHCRRVVLTGKRGLAFLLDLPHATMLHDGDGLVLDDGAIIRVTGKSEPLIEIAARNAQDLARLSWHIGNRHTDIQVLRDRIRIRRDHVLETMITSFGARMTPIEAVFDPEPGVYTHAQQQDHGQ